MKLRILSDGEITGTRVFNAETGEEITSQVFGIEFVHQMGQPPMVRLTLVGTAVEQFRAYMDDSDSEEPQCVLN